MPKPTEVSEFLRPYLSHGVEFSGVSGDERLADCPFCGMEGKFSVSVRTGQYTCRRPGCPGSNAKGGGNVVTFLRRLHASSNGPLPEREALRDARRLLSVGTLEAWGVVKSPVTGEWLVPGYAPDGKVCTLYRYARPVGGKKPILMATAGVHHGLHGVPPFAAKRTAYVCEGPWDAMALWEVLRAAKRGPDGGLTLTGSLDVSLAAEADVYAAPGASVWRDEWSTLLAGYGVVALMYDSDHPKTANGRTVPGSGIAGMRRAAAMMGQATERPAEIHYLNWGPDGYDLKEKDGYDVRDHLTGGANPGQLTHRVAALDSLLRFVKPVPAAWIPGRPKKAKAGGTETEIKDCRTWAVLNGGWRKAMNWTEGLERALACMLASVVSTMTPEDQLWFKIVGPASCGKSTLCEALSVNKRYVIAKSTITGFHSGFDMGGHGDEDNSMIPLVRDKTLVTKDGDTLLQAANLDKILSEARDIYDRVSRVKYGNKVNRDYEGVNMTWLLCGTSSLRALDSSELGERFLDCVIVDKIDEDEERATALRVAYRTFRSVGSNDGAGGADGEDMTRAKQLTGGYVSYLRENAFDLLDEISATDDQIEALTDLGTFVAYLRSRPSKKQDENSERELSYRLCGQVTKLAKCLAVVLNRTTLDDRVFDWTTKVALDTARGRTFEIARHLAEHDALGCEVGQLSVLTGETKDKLLTLLRHLRRIGAVRTVQPLVNKVKQPMRWKLSARLFALYGKVVGDAT